MQLDRCGSDDKLLGTYYAHHVYQLILYTTCTHF